MSQALIQYNKPVLEIQPLDIDFKDSKNVYLTQYDDMTRKFKLIVNPNKEQWGLCFLREEKNRDLLRLYYVKQGVIFNFQYSNINCYIYENKVYTKKKGKRLAKRMEYDKDDLNYKAAQFTYWYALELIKNSGVNKEIIKQPIVMSSRDTYFLYGKIRNFVTKRRCIKPFTICRSILDEFNLLDVKKHIKRKTK